MSFNNVIALKLNSSNGYSNSCEYNADDFVFKQSILGKKYKFNFGNCEEECIKDNIYIKIGDELINAFVIPVESYKNNHNEYYEDEDIRKYTFYIKKFITNEENYIMVKISLNKDTIIMEGASRNLSEEITIFLSIPIEYDPKASLSFPPLPQKSEEEHNFYISLPLNYNDSIQVSDFGFNIDQYCFKPSRTRIIRLRYDFFKIQDIDFVLTNDRKEYITYSQIYTDNKISFDVFGKVKKSDIGLDILFISNAPNDSKGSILLKVVIVEK